MSRKFILYDSRACGDLGTEDAAVLVFCDTEKEATEYKGDFGNMACYSYQEESDGTTLTDEQWEWDYLE